MVNQKRRRPRIFGGVPRKKEKRKEKEEKEQGTELRTVKLAANSIFNRDYARNLVDFFYEKCFKATEISSLASLFFLYQVNDAFDNREFHYFEETDPREEIRLLFIAVTQENAFDLPDTFKEMVMEWTDNEFEWPSRELMGNVFEYMHQQYLGNVTTNLTTHCEQRLSYFLQMKCYQFNQEEDRIIEFDGIDIRNAIKSIMHNEDWSEGDMTRKYKTDLLFAQVKERCLSSFGTDDYLTMTKYVEKKWFESLFFFIHIQREICEFKKENKKLVHAWQQHKKYPLLFQKPNQTMPPKIKNFTVIPLCDTHLKHIKFDHRDLLSLLSQWQLVPEKFGGKDGHYSKESRKYYTENRDEAWNILFDMNKINEIKRPNQQFHHMIVCDSVSVSVIYKQPQPAATEFNFERIKRKLEACEYTYIIPLDPGVNTYLGGFRRNIATCVEENIKIGPEQYHWGAEQGVRDNKAKKMAGKFMKMEEFDREKNYPSIPSPRGAAWKNYVVHKLKMMKDALEVYTRRRYARLSLDKYVGNQRTNDCLAKFLTKNKPSLFNIGNADLPANSPIGKKKTKRCPGTRRLKNSIKKLHHSDVVEVDEAYTSQHCSSCMVKFPKNTKRFRFKMCKNCPRNAPIPNEIAKYMSLPKLIVTKKCSRRKTLDRCLKKMIKRGIIDPANLTKDDKPERLESPKMYYWKNWPLNSVKKAQMGDDAVNNNEQNDQQQQQQQEQQQQQQQQLERENEIQQLMQVLQQFTIVWHRDIVAARCIMYKGLCSIFNLPLLESFKRPPQRKRPPYHPKPPVRRRKKANVVPVQVNN